MLTLIAVAYAEPSCTVDDLRTELAQGESALLDLDDAGVLRLEGARLRSEHLLECQVGIVPTDLAASFHRVAALHAFVAGDSELARGHWTAVKELEPTWTLPEDWTGTALAASFERAPVRADRLLLAGPSVFYDGVEEARPLRPTIAQVVLHGEVRETRVLMPADPNMAVPAEPTAGAPWIRLQLGGRHGALDRSYDTRVLLAEDHGVYEEVDRATQLAVQRAPAASAVLVAGVPFDEWVSLGLKVGWIRGNARSTWGWSLESDPEEGDLEWDSERENWWLTGACLAMRFGEGPAVAEINASGEVVWVPGLVALPNEPGVTYPELEARPMFGAGVELLLMGNADRWVNPVVGLGLHAWPGNELREESLGKKEETWPLPARESVEPFSFSGHAGLIVQRSGS